MTLAGKVGVRFIVLERAEGLHEEVGKPHVVHTYEQADKILKKWAKTVRGNAADKTDFVVIYRDGYNYNGTFFLQKKHIDGKGLLQTHMFEFTAYNAGINRPDHLKPDEYQDYIDKHSQQKYSAQQFLDNYDLEGCESEIYNTCIGPGLMFG